MCGHGEGGVGGGGGCGVLALLQFKKKNWSWLLIEPYKSETRILIVQARGLEKLSSKLRLAYICISSYGQ